MSVRRISKLRAQLIQYGTIATLGALALGAKRYGAPAPASATALSTSGFTRIARGAHPLARPELEIGRLDADKRIENLSIVFKLSPEQLADHDALVEAVSNPASPEFRQWLTPESYAARFGAKPADIARTTAWLASQGLQVSATSSRLGARVIFGGTVGNLEAAFRTEMHQYKVGKETHYAMASAPAVPASLADIVLAIHNTHDFYARPMTHKLAPVAPASQCPAGNTGILCREDAGAGTFTYPNGIAPPDWTSIYNVNPLYLTGVNGKKINGTGVTIAIVGTSEIASSDLTTFWNNYGITGRPVITTTLVPGTGTLGEQGGSAIEAVLDTEWSGAIAPSATINYVVVGQSDQNVDDATYYAIEQNLAGVISESWGGCEAGIPASDADILQTYGSAASLLGITYVAAAGDQLATSCIQEGVSGLYVNIPAAYPGVTSVGGTGFPMPSGLSFTGTSGTLTSVAAGYPAAAGGEQVWNEGNDPNSQYGVGGGGGGVSVLFTRPTYQTLTAAPACDVVGSLPVSGITPAGMRQVPDIAFTAAGGQLQFPIYIECTIDLTVGPIDPTTGQPSGDCAPVTEPTSPFALVPIGGTSASTPAFAGIVALASQAVGGRLGNINPILYSLPTTVFHDVTSGNNEVICTAKDPGCPSTGAKLYGYAATQGFDCASGLGSVDATKFVTQIASLTPTTTTLAAITSPLTEGTPVPLSATVGVTGTTNTNAVGGTVTFAFQTYLANGSPDLTWTLGSAALTGGTATGGTASPSPAFAIPPGMVNSGKGVDVVAMYGGDATHLPSTSAKVHVTFAGTSFCVTPSATNAALGATINFTATGGTPPLKWFVDNDSTSTGDDGGSNGSSIDEATGILTIGTGQPGYVTISALDSNDLETFAEVTVGDPDGGAPWAGDAGIALGCAPPVVDAGSDASAPDSGPGVAVEDGGEDAGHGTTATSSSGCSCTTAGRSDSAPAGMLGGLVLGLGLIARRRRSQQ